MLEEDEHLLVQHPNIYKATTESERYHMGDAWTSFSHGG